MGKKIVSSAAPVVEKTESELLSEYTDFAKKLYPDRTPDQIEKAVVFLIAGSGEKASFKNVLALRAAFEKLESVLNWKSFFAISAFESRKSPADQEERLKKFVDHKLSVSNIEKFIASPLYTPDQVAWAKKLIALKKNTEMAEEKVVSPPCSQPVKPAEKKVVKKSKKSEPAPAPVPQSSESSESSSEPEPVRTIPKPVGVVEKKKPGRPKVVKVDKVDVNAEILKAAMDFYEKLASIAAKKTD